MNNNKTSHTLTIENLQGPEFMVSLASNSNLSGQKQLFILNTIDEDGNINSIFQVKGKMKNEGTIFAEFKNAKDAMDNYNKF